MTLNSAKATGRCFIDNILMETIQKLYESILRFGMAEKHFNKEILPISQMFTLFCPTLVDPDDMSLQMAWSLNGPKTK